LNRPASCAGNVTAHLQIATSHHDYFAGPGTRQNLELYHRPDLPADMWANRLNIVPGNRLLGLRLLRAAPPFSQAGDRLERCVGFRRNVLVLHGPTEHPLDAGDLAVDAGPHAASVDHGLAHGLQPLWPELPSAQSPEQPDQGRNVVAGRYVSIRKPTPPIRKLFFNNDLRKLPARATQRSRLTACLSLPFFTRSKDRRQYIVCGHKPKGFGRRKPTQRSWKSLVRSRPPKNPIRVARKYEEFLQSGDCSYADAAREFGVTKVTVCYYTSLLRRLPPDFVRWLEGQDDPQVLGCFRERRLRPITRLEPDEAKQEALTGLVEELHARNGENGEELPDALRMLGWRS